MIDPEFRERLIAAIARAPRLYPGPVGELVARELADWRDFGYCIGNNQSVHRLVDAVLRAPLPVEQGEAA